MFYIAIILFVGFIFALICVFHVSITEQTIKETSDLKLQKLLVLRNFNWEGGFNWMGPYCTMMADEMAQKHNLKLVVILDTGLYLEREKHHIETYRQHIDPEHNEWFSYYFEPIGIDNPEIRRIWKEGKLHGLPSFSMYNELDEQHELPFIGWEFDRAAFTKRNVNIDYHASWKRNMKLKPYLHAQIEEFYQQHMAGKFIIGAHMRLTDKYGDKHANEDGPVHHSYLTYAKALLREANQQSIDLPEDTKIAIFICSDEQACVDYIQNAIGKDYEVITTGDRVLRSKVVTSGLKLQSHLCGGGLNDKHPDCKQYRSLAAASIHRGHKEHSNYKKGWDAIFEAALLAKSDIFYKSRGNFSNSVTYMNPNMKIIDMVDTLTE